MTWRAFSYTFMVLLAVAAIATTASLGISPDDASAAAGTAQATMLATTPSQPLTDPGTRLVVLLVGILAVSFTYRRAWMNWRSRP